MVNIITKTGDDRSAPFIHSVVRENDRTELCRLRIHWRESKI
jgi:hypothetical protein